MAWVLVYPSATTVTGDVYMAPASPPSGWSAGSDSNNGLSRSAPKLTFAGAFAAMSSGDTLVVADGTYTGESNRISPTQKPPNGPGTGSGDARFTIVMAENAGSVALSQTTGHTINFGSAASYIKIDGVIASGPGDAETRYVYTAAGDGASGYSHHLYAKRCGFWATTGGASHVWSSADYQLFEDCYSYGRSRYGFHHHSPGRYCLYRRCVVRLDDANGGGFPIQGFQFYGTRTGAAQNCIIIDHDSNYWSDSLYEYSGFTGRNEGTDVGSDLSWTGCIALNLRNAAADNTVIGYIAGGNSMTDGLVITDCVAWDIYNGYGVLGFTDGTTSCAINRMTVGDVDGPDYWGDCFKDIMPTYSSVRNSIAYKGLRAQFNNVDNAEYVCANAGGGAGTNFYNSVTPDNYVTYSPLTNGLTYLTRIEAASNLKTAGESGGQIGAQIVYRIGTDGTFYGESGYDTVTATSLWPFPNEATIRTAMRAYSPSNAIDPHRGFCADGETLTHYIHNYLGNGSPY